MANNSGILARKIPWTEEPGGVQSMGVTKESDTTWQLNKLVKTFISFAYFSNEIVSC